MLDCDVYGYFACETPVPPVSEDCSRNGLPDEYNLELPVFPNLDRNEKGIPDECDIASEISADESEKASPTSASRSRCRAAARRRRR